FSKPIVRWAKTLPAVFAFLYPTQPNGGARTEKDPAATISMARSASSESGLGTRPQAGRIDPVEYTPAAPRPGFSGKIFVVVTVNTQGKVIHVEFTAPTAFDLDLVVREAAQRWLFKPAVRNGQTVESRTLVQVPFR